MPSEKKDAMEEKVPKEDLLNDSQSLSFIFVKTPNSIASQALLSCL